VRPTGTLILAAGLSTRMGRPKALLPYRGRTVLEHQVTLYSLFGPVWVAINRVVAPDIQMLGIPAPVFVMEDPAPGLFSTVRPCVSRLRCRVERLLVTPVDCILPDGNVPLALLESQARGSVAVPTYDARPGHPVLLGAEAIVAVSEQPATARFDQVLATLAVAHIPVDEPRIHLNINTPADYTALLTAEAVGRRTP
jgi:molybdenum cofactor cytidylyltransferase